MKLKNDFRKINTRFSQTRKRIVSRSSANLLNRCEPYLPDLTGRLKRSGHKFSKPDQGKLIWVAPYAVMRWHHAKHIGLKGSKWAFRAWYDNKRQILSDAATDAGGKYLE